jgi:Xaa-Pro aminopeptidase
VNSQNKLERLRRKLAENGLGALWVSQPENLYYLTGSAGLEGYLLISAGEAVIVTDFRYVEQVRREAPEYQLFIIAGKMAEWLPKLLAGLNLRNLGFEADHLSFTAYEQMAQILKNGPAPLDLRDAKGLVDDLRMIKDPQEADAITCAIRLTEAAFKHIKSILRPGLTEKNVAWEIEKFMRENGSQPVPFELIVAAGPNSALVHARPSDYMIRSGEPIVIDIGSKHQYYGSDLTRTFCLGQPDAHFQKVYQTVLGAQQAAIAVIRAGMTGAAADAIARQVISQAGYGDNFGHSLGHGIGLATHERPTLGPNSTAILSEGMIFTVEPGIYLSGWGGVRIEDDVIVENGKLRVLSIAGKEDFTIL